MKCPCYKCGNRKPATDTTPSCHSKCDPYKDYQKWRAEQISADHIRALAVTTHENSFQFKEGKKRRKR